ncbi:MAG TPA: pyrroline-5-carboxylate reductase [Bauldia sp.]|nr:pyrroline-5-carboxylate reductase [Bauldia sp.]
MASLTPASPLALVGAGKMGGAMLSGWLAAGLDPKAVVAIDPAPPPDALALLAKAGIAARAEVPPLKARVVVIAVKPQLMATVLPGLKPMVGAETVVLSIAAGKTIASFESALGEVAIVRAMPNTPAQVGRGITAAVGNRRATADDRALVSALLEAVGEVAWLDDEALIDTVTAISGSGPAYVFHFVECLAEAAERLGLPPELAARFARATVEGAGELLHRSDLSPAELRKNVTSPGGTTAAALAVLAAEDGLVPLIVKAATAAKRRSEELSG